MKRRNFITLGALLASVPTLAFAKTTKSVKTFKIVSRKELTDLIEELTTAYPGRKIILKNLTSF